MEQLSKLKRRLLIEDNSQDELLLDLLNDAKLTICNIRNANDVEPQYYGVQVKMAVELYNRMGAEGQISHAENGISRIYEKGSISHTLLNQITPVAMGISGKVRDVK